MFIIVVIDANLCQINRKPQIRIEMEIEIGECAKWQWPSQRQKQNDEY